MTEPLHIDLVITRVLDGEAALAEVAVLRSACAQDPGLRQRLARELALHRLTGAVIAGHDGDARFAAEVVARLQADGMENVVTPIQFEVARRVRRAIRLTRWAWAVAAALVMAAGLAIFMRSRDGAVLTRGEALVWVDGAQHAAIGERLHDGRVVEIADGLAEMEFAAGVSLLLEAPARLTITGPKSAVLDHGRLVARVTAPRGRGFVIDGPTGRVVDLGTEFGINVQPSGEMEVHVLEGTVTAASRQPAESVVTLHQNEGLRLSRGPSQRMPADDGAFVTDLPPIPGRAPGFIRWSCEEPVGNILHNSGAGLAEAEADARLLSGHVGGNLPTRVPGRIGHGLAFDGVDTYAESGFLGIAGQAPRTVTMWAQIPADLSRLQSYAMMGWGKVEGAGNAWQISVNPESNDGSLGALRVGTGKAAVVGTSDLRDGKWHHLTVVMYGGRPTTATHVLLYVDGKLESTTRKSVRAINTMPATEPHGVWLGRNLALRNQAPAGAAFFRGVLDEVQIFSAALDQTMIRQVMAGGAPGD